MPGCPDCGAANMRKRGAFYVCERCGLSFKPWEIEQAQTRARKELENLTSANIDVEDEKKERHRRNYRRWIEGTTDTDD